MCRIDSTGLVFPGRINEIGKPALPGVVYLEYDMFFHLLQMYCLFL